MLKITMQFLHSSPEMIFLGRKDREQSAESRLRPCTTLQKTGATGFPEPGMTSHLCKKEGFSFSDFVF